MRNPFIASILAMGCWASAHAGLKVMDVELGTSNVAQVRQTASASGQVVDDGENSWSGGPMLRVDRPDAGIEGLKSALYIFDKSGKLAGVVLTISTRKDQPGKASRFDELAATLSGKYKQVKKVRPFVGDQYAKFAAQDAVIELDSPHMSFDLQLRYLTPDMMR